MYMAETRTEPAAPLLLIEGLRKSFRDKVALDGIGLDILPASLVVVLGPSGAGKTTLLRTIAGLEEPEQGSIFLDGVDTAGLEPKDRDVAMIFDNLALYPNKTGFDNIASPLVIRKISSAEIDRRVSEIAKTLRISYILKRLPKTMSGGERQRIALGRALIRNPKLFLLDEPLSSLDAKLRIELRAELKRLQRDHGHTFFMATPDFQEAMAVADTIVVLRQGRVIQIGSPYEIYHYPYDREVALFVGAPLINLVQAEISTDNGESTMSVCGGSFPLPPHLSLPSDTRKAVCEIGIRPENLCITGEDSADFHAKVVDTEPQGFKSVITVETGSIEMRLLTDNSIAAESCCGQSVGVSIYDKSRIIAFSPKNGRRLSIAPAAGPGNTMESV